MHRPQYRNPVRNLHGLGLSDASADVNAFRKGGEPALVWAADYGTPNVVKALLARGASVNARDRQGCAALHYAAWNGRVKNVRLLLAAGADVNAREQDGYTPLMGAQNLNVARWLLQHGADVSARTKDGETPLLDAMLSGSPELVAFLLANGADIHARNDEGETALLYHVGLLNDFKHETDVRITQLLLQGGAQVNDCNHEGQSPLWIAVRRLHYGMKAIDTIRLLLQAGAITADENGAKLLAWAKEKGFEEVAALLESPALPLAGKLDYSSVALRT
jgi:ankyrin repeat protein